jgi:uncharacterized protein
VTSVLIHVTKTVTYGRYAAMTSADVLSGLALGGAMMLGSWAGHKVIERLPEKACALMVEALLVAVALSLIIG